MPLDTGEDPGRNNNSLQEHGWTRHSRCRIAGSRQSGLGIEQYLHGRAGDRRPASGPCRARRVLRVRPRTPTDQRGLDCVVVPRAGSEGVGMTGSLSCCSTQSVAVGVRRVPVPAGGHPVVGALLSAIRALAPRPRGTPRRTRHRGRSPSMRPGSCGDLGTITMFGHLDVVRERLAGSPRDRWQL